MPTVKAKASKPRAGAKAPAKKPASRRPGAKAKTAARRGPAGRPAIKRRAPARGGALARTGARADEIVSSLWSNLLSFAAVGVTALGVLALFALFAGGYFHDFGSRLSGVTSAVARGAGFTVGRVTVKGAQSVTEREVMAALWSDEDGSVLGRSLLHVDAEEARARVEAIGAVRHAAVTKLWPDTVHVSLEERWPAALWQDEAGILHLIDEEGVSLRPVGAEAHTDLPVIVGTQRPAGALGVMAALRERPDLARSVAAIVSVRDRRYDLRFRNDFTAKLPAESGEGEVAEALARLDGLGAGTGRLSESLDYIDLRDPKWAYYKPKG